MTILDHFRLRGKTAMVTGASRGIGMAIALGLAEAGADIVNVSRSESAKLRQRIESLGRQLRHLPADLSQLDGMAAADLIAQAKSFTGHLDILVNNAGANLRDRAATFTEQNWQTVIDLNLKATFLLSQAAAREMRSAGGGKIINIASMLSYQGGVNSSAYAASKHGVAGLTKAFAVEWAADNINVNAIAPGYFTTDLTAPLHQDDPVRETIRRRIPAGHWGDPADLQGVAVLLASPAGRYMHGTTVIVDGGWLAR